MFNSYILVKFVGEDFVADAAKHVTLIEVINYFCEMKFEKELERARLEAMNKKPIRMKKTEKARNTVLMLPNVGGYVSF